MSTRIFISYASEDRDFAHEIYRALKSNGLDPWMDKPPQPYDLDGLTIGQRWEDEITGRVQGWASFVILVLSRISVSKVGYVQTEFRLALQAMARMPIGRPFVLPLLKEICEVPNLVVETIKLKDLHWRSVEEIGLNRIIEEIQMIANGSIR